MALVIEDGSIVENADSYVTVADARAYAAKRKKPLPDDDADCEALLIEAMDFLEAKAADYQGYKHMFTQPLQWPRQQVILVTSQSSSPQNGNEDITNGTSYFPDNEIPAALIKAQIILAMEANAGTVLQPTRSGPMAIREKVDVIETQYSEKIGTGILPEIPAVDAILKPLLRCNVGIGIKTFRA